MLKDDHGCWVEDESKLKEMEVSYFQNLFQTEESSPGNLVTKTSFTVLDQSAISTLSHSSKEEEIKNALFSIGPHKAPGFDRFPTIFYQSNWKIVGPSLCKFVQDVFEGK